MYKKKMNWCPFILIWCAIYLVTVLAGSAILVRYTYSANDHLIPVAIDDAREYSKTGEFSKTAVMFRASSYVYNSEGVLTDCLLAEGNNMDFSDRADEMTKTVTDEDSIVYRLIFDRTIDGRLAMVIGVPFFENGSLSSMYYFVKSLTSVYFNFIVLFFSFTFMLILSAIYSAFVIKKNRAVDKLRRDYVANVSHNLKSPIASIMSLSEVMSEGIVVDSEKIRKYSGIILKESRNLEKTVLSMLNLSHLQSGQKDFQKTFVPSDTLLCPIIEKYGAICGEIGITLHVEGSSDSWPILYTNVECISELSETLLDNAVKFVEAGGNIWLTWTSDAKCMTICIRDDGAGISKKDQMHIFERFYRGDSTVSGSGLGLAIASEIAEGLGEKLWVESAAEKGTAFYYTIHLK